VAGWLNWLQGVRLAPAERMMRMDTRMNLADDLLLYGDKISMSVSLEARVPMLDIELVNFVESLPLKYRVALRRTKIAHKRMAESYLPAKIVHRKKKGFQVPFGDWSRGIWKEWIAEKLLDSAQPHLGMICKDHLERMWQQHLRKQPDRSRQIFALLMLALWWEQQ
jgi:asparagine synthase (glutamine-hydrolysing)